MALIVDRHRAAATRALALPLVGALAAGSLMGCAGSSGSAGDSRFAPVTPSAMVAPGSAGAVATTGTPLKLTPASAPAAAAIMQPVPAALDGSAYLIGPLDVLEISVYKVPDLSKSVQVASTGTINLPLVGEVPAAGRTARDVEQDLTRRLGGQYLQNPQVTVFLKEYNSQRVTVEGAVKKPGVYPIQGEMSLLQALALAQGLDVNSDDLVVVFRQEGSERHSARFNVSAIRAGTVQDPMLRAGDMVVANNSAAKEAFNNLIKALPIATLVGGL